LALLVLVVAIPLLLAVGYVVRQQAQGDEGEARVASEAVAQLVAARIDAIVAESRNALSTLARRPRVQAVDGSRCDPFLQEYAALAPRAANVGVVSLDGRVVCSAVPQPGGTPADVNRASWFEQALATEEFLAGEPFVGPITGRWVSVLVEPIRSPAGDLRGFLALPLDLMRLSADLGQLELPEARIVSVVTPNGVVVARSKDAAEWVGRDVGDTDVVRSLGTEGAYRGKGFSDEEMIFGFAGVRSAEWIVVSGVPVAIAYAPSRSAAWHALLIALVAVVSALVLALLIARSIRAPLARLTGVAQSMGRGSDRIRAQEKGPREVVQLAVAFNEMVDARQANQRRFNALADSSVVMIWTDDRFTGEEFYSAGWLAMRGRTLEEEQGDPYYDGIHPDDRPTVEALHEDVYDAPREFSAEYRVRSAAGEYRTILEHGVPVFLDTGEFEGYVGTDIDIRDRLRLVS
jgi:PAS domain S-box-containing protein